MHEMKIGIKIKECAQGIINVSSIEARGKGGLNFQTKIEQVAQLEIVFYYTYTSISFT